MSMLKADSASFLYYLYLEILCDIGSPVFQTTEPLFTINNGRIGSLPSRPVRFWLGSISLAGLPHSHTLKNYIMSSDSQTKL